MNKTLRLLSFLLTISAVAPPGVKGQESGAPAAEGATAAPRMVDQVRVQDGKLIAVAGGETFSPTNLVTMVLGIKVMTNLTFSVKEGSPRKLAEGQILGKDGMLQSPDGSLVPVMDHVTQANGKVFLHRDGVVTVLTDTSKLGDGSTVMADGTFIDKSGRRTRLLDGQVIKLDGSTLPATDTATLSGGKVVVQKDGSMITLKPAQTMMMSDGTKVSGSGLVTEKDGGTRQLAEGEILKIEGVRRR